MRIVTLVALLALSGYAMLATAAKEPANSQESGPSIIDRGGKQISAKKDASVVRTRQDSSSRNVSEVLGRR